MKIRRQYLILLIIILGATLRLFALDRYPNGLNADEAAIGYNAYSLIETGRDEHRQAWPLVFRSFDDYKPPVYFYLVLPFVKLLGLNIWSVRLPSAILGILTIYLLFLFVKLLYPKSKSYLPELSAFFLAISPWHLQFSRGGWEVNAASFFVLLSLYSLVKSFEKINYLYVFGLSSVLSLYTYHSARVILPLLILSFIKIYWSEVRVFFSKSNLKITLSVIILGALFCLPLVSQLVSIEGRSRFNGVSIFADKGPEWEATELRGQHVPQTKISVVLHNRYITYGLRFIQNYLSHFSPEFLFVSGDQIDRNRVPDTGQLFLFSLPLVFVGFLGLLRSSSKANMSILMWLMLSPIAASMTYQSPHALRAENMSIPLSLICGAGLLSIYSEIKKRNVKLSIIAGSVLVLLLSYNFSRYLHNYYVHYPAVYPTAWQYGFSEIAKYTSANYNSYDRIIISTRYDQPYILLAFFTQYSPEKLQKELVMSSRDSYGFSTGLSFGKYEFRTINYEKDILLKNTLLVSANEPVDSSKAIHKIISPDNNQLFTFISTNHIQNEKR